MPDGWADAVKKGTCLKVSSDAAVKSVKVACVISTASNKATMTVSSFSDDGCAQAASTGDADVPPAVLKEDECYENPVVPTTWIKFGKL